MPAGGSPSSATSGTARPADASLTTPSWYAGRLNRVEKPPPEPYRNGGVKDGTQPLPFADRSYLLVPQPVCQRSPPPAPISVLVPPTPVTHGSLVGKSVWTRPLPRNSSPSSPDESMKPMPCIAPCLKICSYAATMPLAGF